MANSAPRKKRTTGLRLGLAALALAVAAAIGWEIGQPDEVPVEVSEATQPVPAETSALQDSPVPALAQQVAPRQESFGSYRVEYSALHSSVLPAASLETYGIRPGPTTGILTMRIINTDSADPASPAATVPATVKAYKVNMADQLDGINMRRIEQNGYTSYVGSYTVTPPEDLRFQVEVTPENGPTHRFTVKQAMHVPG